MIINENLSESRNLLESIGIYQNLLEYIEVYRILQNLSGILVLFSLKIAKGCSALLIQ